MYEKKIISVNGTCIDVANLTCDEQFDNIVNQIECDEIKKSVK